MKRIVFFLLTALTLTSCGAYKRLAYFQDLAPGDVFDVTQTPETKINRGDILNIQVLSSQPVLAAPFNIMAENTAVAGNGNISTVQTQSLPEYTVDLKGCINFPVIGNLPVEGMTLDSLRTVLVDKIIQTQYLKDPMVVASFKNFKITVLGEVNSVGNYNFPTGEVNIVELLAEVGDMTQDAKRDNLWVIRTKEGKRTVYQLNPKSKDIFDSPAYYLQQNDIVYVAPKDTKMDNNMQNLLSWSTFPLTFFSTIMSGLTYARVFAR